jgi:hypothetical protein
MTYIVIDQVAPSYRVVGEFDTLQEAVKFTHARGKGEVRKADEPVMFSEFTIKPGRAIPPGLLKAAPRKRP